MFEGKGTVELLKKVCTSISNLVKEQVIKLQKSNILNYNNKNF